MLRWIGVTATAALALAAATGVLLRFGIYQGMPGWAFNYGAVRHAHSHLMYFGWVSLVLMLLIWHELPRLTGNPRPRGSTLQMGVAAFLALLSFPAFWSNGYGMTQIGAARLPLGSIVAGLNVLAWYAFAALYVRATWRTTVRPLPMQLWDWGLGLLVLSTAGLFGLVLAISAPTVNPLIQQLFLHLFLDLFAAGWFTLALLGVLWAKLGHHAVLSTRLPTGALALSIIPTFMLGMSPGVVTPAMFWVAAGANAISAALIARHLAALWQRRRELALLVQVGGVALAIHLLIAVALLWPGVWQWSAGTQLRVFYLHNFLLGAVSTILLALLLEAWLPTIWRVAAGRLVAGLWIAGCAVMIGALALLGLAQFVPIAPLTLLQVAAWSSLLPAAAAILALAAWLPAQPAQLAKT